jgi:hypothetical protein
MQGDVDMAAAEAVVAPIVIHNPKEPVSRGLSFGRDDHWLHSCSRGFALAYVSLASRVC